MSFGELGRARRQAAVGTNQGFLFDFVTDKVISDIIRKRGASKSSTPDRYLQRLAGGHVTLQ
jgi:hypothetical protein